MPSPTLGLLNRQTRSHWVRLRTLVLLRWLAIAGQLLAITVADRYVGLNLDLGLCYLAVAASVVANLFGGIIVAENRRLSESEVMLTLLFDIAQLSFLLYLCGGVTNPFALLLLAPVTISATALQLRTTVFLGAMAIILITVVTLFHQPLVMKTGEALLLPRIFEFGYWLAIVVGIVFLGLYARRVSAEIHAMSDALMATQMALAREQKLTDLGGVVAAAAHELGTPLATIKLVSAEMAEELQARLPDHRELREDAELIRSQADRCRDILRSMGRAGKDDLMLRNAPVGSVLKEAAEPHLERGKDIRFDFTPGADTDPRQPVILRRPEVIHGLRNLIQNAVDFASSTVRIEAEWTDSTLSIRITDDGAGFPPQVLGRIGTPFVRVRRSSQDRRARPEYDGMGLGLFIAKTLLERTGARISFANTRDTPRRAGLLAPPDPDGPGGAVVEVTWPRDRISPESGAPLGENQPFAF